ncbi:hypothetical protein P7K49_028253 [Saguinus oedipus]|uniref:Uncharacterized protein n=1 Tax=Saguinus oedipus TaxID=9490 RepID=A0ABQ9UCQ4_SAGOE|nr:hypothetical protein P7K49_028253 [Saguinus oedipus]
MQRKPLLLSGLKRARMENSQEGKQDRGERKGSAGSMLPAESRISDPFLLLSLMRSVSRTDVNTDMPQLLSTIEMQIAVDQDVNEVRKVEAKSIDYSLPKSGGGERGRSSLGRGFAGSFVRMKKEPGMHL